MRQLPAWMIVLTLACRGTSAAEPFGIRVIDEQTGRGVPLVELRTVNEARFVTDSAGYAAIQSPELLDQTVFFHVRSHGYEFPADGFGIRGRALKVASGGRETLKVKRLNIAERLYRVTGAGIYADSVALGEAAPLHHPLLNGKVVGSDSVVMTAYRDRIYWFWGDTLRFQYPLGNFNVTGATSRLPGDGGLDPAVGVDLDYFTGDDGFARPMARMPGEGLTWIFGVVVLKEGGRERLFAGYEKVRPPLDVYQRGICEFDDERQEFVHVAQYDKDVPLHLYGHPFHHRDNDVDYVYFGDPYPVIRVRADAEALLDLKQYEGFTCLTQGGRETAPVVERDADGNVVWDWKRDTAAITSAFQESLIKQKKLKPDERWIHLTDGESGNSVEAHRGSVTWNSYRRKWLLVTTQIRGQSSMLGEVWYAEADRPEGPWAAARQILSHDKYSFYNPKQHPQFTADGGRTIYFEGTYTRTFSGNDVPTPRYEYNQVMYRLDLTDPRLALPPK